MKSLHLRFSEQRIPSHVCCINIKFIKSCTMVSCVYPLSLALDWDWVNCVWYAGPSSTTSLRRRPAGMAPACPPCLRMTNICRLSSTTSGSVTTLSAFVSSALCFCLMHPERRLGMSYVSPLSGISGLSFDSTLLSPLLIFCWVLLLFLSYLFYCLLAHSSDIFPENSSIFFC